MIEGHLKLLKALKDMLDHLVMKKKDYKGIKVRGFLHSGLTMQVMTADRSHPYVTRVSRGRELNISSNVERFGSEVLPVLVQVWQVKQNIIRIREFIKSSTSNEEKNDGSWLDECLKVSDDSLVVTLTAGSP